MRPLHFHLACAVLLGAIAIAALLIGRLELGCFVGLGAFVALLQWKAAKSGVTE